MSILNTVSNVSNNVSLGSSALSLIGMGTSLFRTPLAKGIDGFVFDIALTESINNSAQITDHFSEDNAYLNDHIAINPMVITFTGTIGELVFTKEKRLEFIKAMVNRLTPLGVLTPSQSTKATQYLAKAETLRSAYDSLDKTYKSLKNTLDGKTAKTKQAVAYATLQEIFLTKKNITVETPWQTFSNMFIESFTTDQDDTTTMETTFTVVCKQLRFVGVQTITRDLIKTRYDAATSMVKNTGIQTGDSADSTEVISKATPQ